MMSFSLKYHTVGIIITISTAIRIKYDKNFGSYISAIFTLIVIIISTQAFLALQMRLSDIYRVQKVLRQYDQSDLTIH